MKLTKAFDIKSQLTEQLLHNTGELRKSYYLAEGLGYSNFIGDPVSVINGVGLGFNRQREYFVKVYTETNIKFNKEYLADIFRITSNDILVSAVGTIKPQANTTDRIRPAFPGISIGHFQVTAGTFGCVVGDDFGSFFILSNNHVLANSNNCNIGDVILQPGMLDGGHSPNDEIASLFDFIPIDRYGINAVDAAIATPVSSYHIKSTLPVIGRIRGVGNPRIGMRVAKFGRTTGYTTGTITTRGVDIKVNFGGTLIEFEDQLEIVGNNGTAFSSGGDSGSVIIDVDTNQAVGLLFAGADGGSTFANPMMTVLNHFDLKII